MTPRNISWADRDESERTHALCQTLGTLDAREVRDGSHRSIAPFSKERDFSSSLCDCCHARFLLRAIPWICARAPSLSHTNFCFSRERFGRKKRRIQTREISIHMRLGKPLMYSCTLSVNATPKKEATLWTRDSFRRAYNIAIVQWFQTASVQSVLFVSY